MQDKMTHFVRPSILRRALWDDRPGPLASERRKKQRTLMTRKSAAILAAVIVAIAGAYVLASSRPTGQAVAEEQEPQQPCPSFAEDQISGVVVIYLQKQFPLSYTTAGNARQTECGGGIARFSVDTFIDGQFATFIVEGDASGFRIIGG